MVAELRPGVNGTKQRLVEAAAGLFAERGYEQATLMAIGAAAGVTAPALYRHFRSKEDLLLAVLVSYLQEAVQQTEVALGELDLVDRLKAVVGVQIDLRLRLRGSDGPAAFNLGHLSLLLPPEKRQQAIELMRSNIRLLADLVRAGARAGVFKDLDPTPTAFAVMGMLDAALWLRPSGRLDAQEIRELYQKLALEMVVKP